MKQFMKKYQIKNWVLSFVLAAAVMLMLCPDTIYADTSALDGVKTQINTFNELLAAVVSGIGAAVLLWSFMKMGMAMQHGGNGGVEAQSLSSIIGGIIMVLAPQIILIFTTA